MPFGSRGHPQQPGHSVPGAQPFRWEIQCRSNFRLYPNALSPRIRRHRMQPRKGPLLCPGQVPSGDRTSARSPGVHPSGIDRACKNLRLHPGRLSEDSAAARSPGVHPSGIDRACKNPRLHPGRLSESRASVRKHRGSLTLQAIPAAVCSRPAPGTGYGIRASQAPKPRRRTRCNAVRTAPSRAIRSSFCSAAERAPQAFA